MSIRRALKCSLNAQQYVGCVHLSHLMQMYRCVVVYTAGGYLGSPEGQVIVARVIFIDRGGSKPQHQWYNQFCWCSSIDDATTNVRARSSYTCDCFCFQLKIISYRFRFFTLGDRDVRDVM